MDRLIDGIMDWYGIVKRLVDSVMDSVIDSPKAHIVAQLVPIPVKTQKRTTAGHPEPTQHTNT